MRLNLYLKARKNDVSSGVPGKFLHAVIGQDVSGNFLCSTMKTLFTNLFNSWPFLSQSPVFYLSLAFKIMHYSSAYTEIFELT